VSIVNTAEALRFADGKRAIEAYLGTKRVWPCGPALPPATVYGGSSSKTGATVMWSPVVGALEYIVYRNGVEVARVSSSTLKHMSSGLSSNTTYSFQVAAVTLVGVGNLSLPFHIRTMA
jgi:hypothetical protein